MRTRLLVLGQARIWVVRFVVLVAVVLLVLLCVGPLFWMATSSLKPRPEIFAVPPSLLPSDWRFSNYAEIFTIAPFARQYVNSLYIAIANTLGVLVVASLAGYAFARIRFRGRSLLFLVLMSGLLLPEEVTLIPLFDIFGRLGWIGTHLPLIILPIFTAQALAGTFIMRQFFLSLPIALEEAGTVDGLNRFGLFRRIALPLSGPALATVGILAFLGSWNSFLQPLVFVGGQQDLYTLPIAIIQYTTFDLSPSWQHQLGAATLSVIPMVVVFLFAEQFFTRGFATVGVRG